MSPRTLDCEQFPLPLHWSGSERENVARLPHDQWREKSLQEIRSTGNKLERTRAKYFFRFPSFWNLLVLSLFQLKVLLRTMVIYWSKSHATTCVCVTGITPLYTRILSITASRRSHDDTGYWLDFTRFCKSCLLSFLVLATIWRLCLEEVRTRCWS